MGTQRTGTGFPGDLVFDAGALIAFERGDREVRSVLNGVLSLGAQVVIPATALAQAWRGGPRSALLACLERAAEVDCLDLVRAKEVGIRLGDRGASDVADSHVVCCAFGRRATVATSDPDDIRALATPAERLAVIAV